MRGGAKAAARPSPDEDRAQRVVRAQLAGHAPSAVEAGAQGPRASPRSELGLVCEAVLQDEDILSDVVELL